MYRFYDTVSVTFSGSIDDFNANLFAQLISDLLGVTVEVAAIIASGDK